VWEIRAELTLAFEQSTDISLQQLEVCRTSSQIAAKLRRGVFLLSPVAVYPQP